MSVTTTLFFPEPLLRRPDLPDRAPRLYRLLCRGDCEALAEPDPCAILCSLFALPPGAGQDPPGPAGAMGTPGFALPPGAGQDPPVAALRLVVAGQEPGADTWICADPVRLVADLNGLFLYALAEGTLDMGEAEALAGRLEPVFAPYGMALRVLSPRRWCLHIRQREHAAVQTTSLAVAAGRDVRTLLPRGEGQRFWHRLLTECQMALHDDRVDPPATAPNSLWFWGAGGVPGAREAPGVGASSATAADTGTGEPVAGESALQTGESPAALPSSSCLRVFADEPLCQALAERAGVFCAPLPGSLPGASSGGVPGGGSADVAPSGASPSAPTEISPGSPVDAVASGPADTSPDVPSGTLPGGPGETARLFVLGAVDPPAPQDTDPLAWLEDAWFSPALEQLRAGHLRRLTILDNTHRLTIDRRALWRFWRRKPRWPG